MTNLTFTPKELNSAFKYIDDQWQRLERYWPKNSGSLIGLPHPYFVPSSEDSEGFQFEEMYYWDSYFISLGLIGTKNESHAENMLENMIFLLKRFHKIPNGNRYYFTSRSQPPFLTSYIAHTYKTNQNKRWLARMAKYAEFEYKHVWLGTMQPNIRKVHKGLSRYYDINVLHDLAEAESGWDMTSRFNRKCLDYLPICLNSLLYKYEKDFAYFQSELNHGVEAKKWEEAAKNRKKTIMELMYNQEDGMFYDYNYQEEQQGTVRSLAAFYPLWAGMLDEEEARKLVNNLKHFEHDGGLSTTDVAPPDHITSMQWAFPNGWAPLQYMVIVGLQRYGYSEEAERLARKWIRTCLIKFENKGEFIEKYNVVNPKAEPETGVYPDQVGFAWTNAIFWRLAHDILSKDELPKKHRTKKLKMIPRHITARALSKAKQKIKL